MKLVFTDGSANGIAACVVDNDPHTFQTPYFSAQLVELYAILQVFLAFPHKALNIYTDSSYFAHFLPLLETVPYIKVSSGASPLFLQIQTLIHSHTLPFFVGHFCTHSGLPKPFSEGNTLADLATRHYIYLTSRPDPFELARQAHFLHHLNVHSLRVLFKITHEQAQAIVKTCQACIPFHPVAHLEVIPRSLLPNDLWQMDVTHVPSFGKLQYVHVSIDTYSGVIYASPLSGETSRHAISHVISCLAVTD